MTFEAATSQLNQTYASVNTPTVRCPAPATAQLYQMIRIDQGGERGARFFTVVCTVGVAHSERDPSGSAPARGRDTALLHTHTVVCLRLECKLSVTVCGMIG